MRFRNPINILLLEPSPSGSAEYARSTAQTVSCAPATKLGKGRLIGKIAHLGEAVSDEFKGVRKTENHQMGLQDASA